MSPRPNGRPKRSARRLPLPWPGPQPRADSLAHPNSGPRVLRRGWMALGSGREAKVRRLLGSLLKGDRLEARDRLYRAGVSSLSDAELLALILAAGAPGKSARQIAESVLSSCGGLKSLCQHY